MIPEDVDHLDLGHDVELATAPAKDVDVGERLESRARYGFSPCGPLRDGTHLAVLGREQGDDAVCLAEANRPQNDSRVAIVRHLAQRLETFPPRTMRSMPTTTRTRSP